MTRRCREYNDANLAVAKSNIERNFITVLIVEKMLLSFTVLEKKLPAIFSGMTEKYKHPTGSGKELRSRINYRTLNEKDVLNPNSRSYLERELALEYDLYGFSMKRLHDQARACHIDVTHQEVDSLMGVT